MKLTELAERLPQAYEARLLHAEDDPEISLLAYDSRKISPHSQNLIFACVRGGHTDGHDLAAQPPVSGCAAFLCERELPLGTPQLIVKNTRAAMGEAAALLRGRPADALTMIALTGTNGKTTTAYLARAILRASGRKTGMMGTIVCDDGMGETDAIHTTPEGPDVQELLANMRKNGCEACVMEASSHGLDQGRLAGCAFDRAGFSNLTSEHLEYHRDLESYFAAKRLLFSDYMRGEWWAHVNADDPYGARLLRDFRDNASGFSLRWDSSAGYRAKILKHDIEGLTLDLRYPDGEVQRLFSSLIGEYNASNILEAAAIADSLRINRNSICEGIRECSRVPGRLERYDLGNGVTAFVDFAHSSDSMEKVLLTLTPLATGKIWVAWGAGGDRTPVKRPVVGGIMARLADRVVVTSDNPRSESPAVIAAQVEAGVLSARERKRGMCHKVILDRREAICHMLDNAESGDVLLIAGKGPERFIDYGDRREPFLDSDVLLTWARERGVGVS